MVHSFVDGRLIEQARDHLAGERLVVIPTETVYGLAANAWSPSAVAKIFAAKGRPSTNPLIVHVASVDRLSDAVAMPIDAVMRRRLDALADLWPGPLTIVLPVGPKIPSIVTANRDTVAVRIPDQPIAQALLQRCEFPIAAPSANRSLYVSPTMASHCTGVLGDDVAMILDGGPCRFGVESTIVSLVGPMPRLLRPGGVTAETLAERLGVSVDALVMPERTDERATQPSANATAENATAEKTVAMEAPGMMSVHYRPTTPLRLIDRSSELRSEREQGSPPDPKSGLARHSRRGRIAFSPLDSCVAASYDHVVTLSPDGDLAQVSHGLFAAIRQLDQGDFDEIVVDVCPPHGLGRAIMDRLSRAAADGGNESAGVSRGQ